MCTQAFQLGLTHCDPMDYSPPGSSFLGILQARILEWVAMPSPGDLPNPRIKAASLISPTLTGKFFTTSATFHKYFHHGKCSHHSQFKASDMMFLSMKLGRDANNWLLVLVSSSMLLKCCYRRQGKEWVQEDKEVKQECDLKVPPKLESPDPTSRLQCTSFTSVIHVAKTRMVYFHTHEPINC